jgi:hypothetical protein
MECTKCKKTLDLEYFTYKNVQKKIYYFHCDFCREKIKKQKNKKNLEYDNYYDVKINNLIHCACGKKYVAFREFHIYRHENTKSHIKYVSK